MKRCSKCGETKAVSEFNKNRRAKDGLYHWCQECARAGANAGYHRNRDRYLAQMKVYREANKEALREKDRKHGWRYMLMSRYKMTIEQHNTMLVEQRNRCAVCDSVLTKINIDHDHKTGVVRGLLCTPCNQAIGFLRDDALLLRSAAKYIEDSLKRTTRSA